MSDKDPAELPEKSESQVETDQAGGDEQSPPTEAPVEDPPSALPSTQSVPTASSPSANQSAAAIEEVQSVPAVSSPSANQSAAAIEEAQSVPAVSSPSASQSAAAIEEAQSVPTVSSPQGGSENRVQALENRVQALENRVQAQPTQSGASESHPGTLHDGQQWELEPEPVGIDAPGSSNQTTSSSGNSENPSSGKKLLYQDYFNFGDYVNWTAEKKAAAAALKGPGGADQTSAEPTESESAQQLIAAKREEVLTGGSMAGESDDWELEKDPEKANQANAAAAAAAAAAADSPTPQTPAAALCGPDASGARQAQAPLALTGDGSMSYEDQAWVLEKDPALIGQVAFFEYALKDPCAGPVQTQTDADGNCFQNNKGTDCTKPSTGACEGCTHAADQCFPNQTECIDLEYTQLVGVAQDFADVAQGFFVETKQLGWYIVSQCLQFMDDDICDPCACRNATTDDDTAPTDDAPTEEAADGSIAKEGEEKEAGDPEFLNDPPAEGEESIKDKEASEMLVKDPSEMAAAEESKASILQKDASSAAVVETPADAPSESALPEN